jgi:rsbT co-antagonist protein RsbR
MMSSIDDGDTLMSGMKSRIGDVLQRHESDLLTEWLKEQTSAGTLRPDLMKESELREQSGSFLPRLREATISDSLTDIKQPGWKPVRELLEEISRSRALQGFTTTETATFVLSLKQPLFTRLRKAHEGPDALFDDIWTATVMLDKLGLYTAEVFQKTRENVIARQQDEMFELSSPVVQLWEGIIGLPLIGTLDSKRTQVVMETLLKRLSETQAEVAIIDITGVPIVDTLTAQHLLKAVKATRLMGSECIISGIRPQIAQTIVHLGVDLGDVVTKSTLAGALAVAFKRRGLAIRPLVRRPDVEVTT